MKVTYGFKAQTLKLKLLKSILWTIIIVSFFTLFFERYKLYFDYHGARCLDARLFLIDKYDVEAQTGKLVALTGDGIPLLKDNQNYIKFVGGIAGDTVKFDGRTITNDNGYSRYAPTNNKYKELKRKHNLPTEWKVQDGQVFLFGDTSESLDSRVVGLADSSKIFGTAYVIY
ncbi:hypothetical protein UA32_11970 [Photobacterium angustum]|uniref:Peptidase S26 domain-containing protein n=1 Tax=Photobacterium angustum TaxID=661 RepID=A0ABX5GY15_PHOAN|nr:S26 family signal peptidase [Photobacterium angustum]KJG37674.1 hypothetical protein UA32_11970 [Photobacterium angustum]PSX01656.1 hypothetical protein C0W27_21960 [Photobacterium angustum]